MEVQRGRFPGSDKYNDAKGRARVCLVVIILCACWLAYGATVDFYRWASLIFLAPTVLIFFAAAITGVVALGFTEKHKQEKIQERKTEYQKAKREEEMMASERARSWIDELDAK